MWRLTYVYPIILLTAGTAAVAQIGAKQAGSNVDLSQYPAATISNKFLNVRLYLAEAQKGYYRGTRFDWSGLISRVEYKGHTFFCEFKQEHDPLNHDDICGTAEEFGMTVPPAGYEQAHQGERFVKIGIGVLQRGDDASFEFWRRYTLLKPGQWQVNRTKDAIEFTQELQGPAGWSYSYTKTLRLRTDAPVLTISRRLKNTGTNAINTDHYGHNFLRIDNAPAGPDYSLELPFPLRFGEKSQPQGSVELKGNSLVFTKEVWDKAVWVRLDGFSQPEDNRIRVVNRRSGASVTITTDRPLSRLVLYSSGGVVCPEPFVKISVGPGETQEWTTSYTFASSR
jgi:hypothetical protein